VPIGPFPILWHIMKIYAHYGHKEFILCLGYKGEIIREYFRNYLWNVCDTTLTLGAHPTIQFHGQHGEQDWKVTLAETGAESMTAYRIRLIERYLGEDNTFLLTYGDGLGNININEVIAFHERKGKICTISGVHPPGRFGELSIAQDDLCIGFNEKPQAEGGYINGGYMVCNRRLFEYLPDDPGMMLEQTPMKNLTRDKQLSIYTHDGFWQPMDTYQEYALLNRLWAQGKAPWKIWN